MKVIWHRFRHFSTCWHMDSLVYLMEKNQIVFKGTLIGFVIILFGNTHFQSAEMSVLLSPWFLSWKSNCSVLELFQMAMFLVSVLRQVDPHFGPNLSLSAVVPAAPLPSFFFFFFSSSLLCKPLPFPLLAFTFFSSISEVTVLSIPKRFCPYFQWDENLGIWVHVFNLISKFTL